MQCNAMQCNAMQYNTMQYNTTQHNTTQHNTTQYNNIESMLPPTNDWWPRTMLVCAKGMMTKIKKRIKFARKIRVSVMVLRSGVSWFQTRGPQRRRHVHQVESGWLLDKVVVAGRAVWGPTRHSWCSSCSVGRQVPVKMPWKLVGARFPRITQWFLHVQTELPYVSCGKSHCYSCIIMHNLQLHFCFPDRRNGAPAATAFLCYFEPRNMSRGNCSGCFVCIGGQKIR